MNQYKEYSGKGFDTNAITEFMNPSQKIVKVCPDFIKIKSNLNNYHCHETEQIFVLSSRRGMLTVLRNLLSS